MLSAGADARLVSLLYDPTGILWEVIMTLRSQVIALGLLGVLGIWGLQSARAAELTIFLNQATESGVRELAAGFERATGNKVNVTFKAGNALYQSIRDRAEGDLTSLSLGQFDEFVKGGQVVPGSVVEYARVGNGVAVKAGAPQPDISTLDGFKQAMLNAKSIGHTRVGTGPFNTKLFQRLGIYDQIKDKIKFVEGKLVAAAVADGDVEIGIQQTNVIQPYAGTVYLGPLPAGLMEYGPVAVGLLAVSKHPDEAKAFIKFMADPANTEFLKKGAMYPPVS
jgi:molybdate transport system substrate-binding protein